MNDQQQLGLPGRSNQFLTYWQWGNLSDRPLLLLHGLGDCAAVWEGAAQELAKKGYGVVAPDLPGHGNSSKGDRPYTTEAIIEDLEALCNHLGWSRVTVVGHSWMGKVVTRWMQDLPQRFQQAVIVDPFFIGKMPDWLRLSFPILYRTLPFLKLTGPFPDQTSAEDCARQLKQYREWNPWQAAAFAANLEQKDDGTWGSKLDLLARDRVFEDVLGIAGFQKSVSSPTLLILPEQGLNQFAWQTRDFHQFCERLTVQTVPGNHWPFLNDPIGFAETIDRWLIAPAQERHNFGQVAQFDVV